MVKLFSSFSKVFNNAQRIFPGGGKKFWLRVCSPVTAIFVVHFTSH